MWKNLDAKQKAGLTQAVYSVVGSLLFALGVNLIIVPMSLYNGGFMGIAQLIRTFIVDFLHVPGARLAWTWQVWIYFVMNIPLFYLGYRVLGRAFAVKTLVTVAIQSMFMMIVPIPAEPIIEDYLTACIIGGIVAGTVPDLSFAEEAPAAARISSAFAVPRDFRTSVLAGLIS